MRRTLIYFITFATAFACSAARAECINEQIADAVLPAVRGGHVWAKACSDQDENGGNIYITISTNNDKKNQETLRYDQEGYSLSLDTDIYFGNPQMQGIGVATGAGRDGNGTHYWAIDNSSEVIDLGDAPSLKRDPFVKNSYSALVTSSGAPYQSILYFYTIKDGKLIPAQAVGFQTGVQGNIASLLTILPGNKFEVNSTKRLSKKAYDACQNSEIACW
ncbi:hypothetical protein [Paraburkholderia sp. J63]|uniref:hypothetical protein n=1 Tax=Paraburkholderia sp. J63 TaxID=2805434 RepID=UPI002ABD7C71|nr:hypothetical protein [Paraburkholderia sp. J63]